MTSKEQLKFIRNNAWTVALNYKGCMIWLVGSDDGWWEAKDCSTGEVIESTRSASKLENLISAVDAWDERRKRLTANA